MNNLYTLTDMTHSEMVIALEDFEYGSKVKCYIPSLMPLLNKDKIVEEKLRVNSMNIHNKNLSILGIGKYTSCNYVELFVPNNISDSKTGSKGDKFAAVFLGGDINRCVIIGRYVE